MLASAGLDASIFSDPDAPLPCTALGRLLSACVARTACRHFGLLVGAKGGPSSLGLVGLLIHGAADVGTALRQTVLSLHLHDPGAVAVLSSQGDVAQLTYAIYTPGVASSEQMLSRRLRAEGTTFEALLEEVRYEVAYQLLGHSDLLVRDVADAAAFTRAFRRWSGTAPARWRAASATAPQWPCRARPDVSRHAVETPVRTGS